MCITRLFAASLLLASIYQVGWCQGEASSSTVEQNQRWGHQRDVVYGYKDGMALVLEVFTPKQSKNGAAVIRLMSGGMFSDPNWSHIAPNYRPEVRSLLDHGYVVFAVAHSCRPKYTIDEAHRDVSRCVRYIRHNAPRYGVDANRIGIMGASSGGHLSLLAATAPQKADPNATDVVDRESSSVQAVVSYYAGTDNLNFGVSDKTIVDHFQSLGQATGEFDFHQWDEKRKRFERISDPMTIRERLRLTSPIAHVNANTPLVLLLHGENDKLVPIQQSEVLVRRLQTFGIPHRLLRVPSAGHGFNNGWEKPMPGELPAILDWLDQHLLAKKGHEQ